MPVINGVYLKDFTALPGAVADANIIPIAIAGNQVAYRTTVAGIITDARITGKLLTGLSITGSAILATDTILQAFGKVQNQLNNRVSSVGLTMPSAFSVANSPITGSGTLAVTANGLASQYIRGDGALADFPTGGGGGGSSVSYYLNGSVNQGTFGGNVYYEMNKTPIFGAGTDFSIAADGYIAQFITDANDPNSLLIPAGNWNFETYFSASSSGGTPSFYVELYKYNGTTFTLIASNAASPELIAFGTTINPYFSALAVPETVLLATDRLAIRVYVNHSGRTITLHTENSHLCQIITTFTTGLQSLNGLTSQTQYFAVGTSGTDFAISSSVDTHTFNLPTASATNRGALSSTDWTTFNGKIGGSGTTNYIPKFTGASSIGNSAITDDGTTVKLINRVLSQSTNTSQSSFTTADNVGLEIKSDGSTASDRNITFKLGTNTRAIINNAGILGLGINPSTWGSNRNAIQFGGLGAVFSDNNATSEIGANVYISTASAYTYLTSNFATRFAQINGQFQWHTAASGTSGNSISFTQAMTLANGGNLLLGTTTDAGYKLDVNGTGRFSGALTAIQGNFNQTAISGFAITMKNRNANQQWNFVVDTDTVDDKNFGLYSTQGGLYALKLASSTGAATFSSSVTSNAEHAFYFQRLSGVPGDLYSWSSDSSAAYLYNHTKAKALMYILEDGNVGIGTTSPSGKLQVVGGSTTTSIANAATTVNSRFDVANPSISLGIGYVSADIPMLQSFNNVTNGATSLTINPFGGNVGIGTTSPSARLDVVGSAGIRINEDGAGTKVISIRSDFAGVDPAINVSTNNALLLQTNNTERMRITSGGNVLIGTTTDAGYKLDVNGTGRFSGNTLIGTSASNTPSSPSANIGVYVDTYAFIDLATQNGEGSWIDFSKGNGVDYGGRIRYQNSSDSLRFFTNNSSTPSLTLVSTGAATFSSLGTGTVYSNAGTLTNTNPSDSNLKTNIQDLSYGLNEIMQLRPVSYLWKNDKINQGKQFGFIAQEVQEIMPDLVKEGEYLGLDKEAIFVTLVNAIKELNNRIIELENK